MLFVGIAALLFAPGAGSNAATAKQWPPASPVVSPGEGLTLDGHVRPLPAKAAAGMCAHESQFVHANDCRITRFDGGDIGFAVVGGSKQSCDVLADHATSQEGRWVFGDGGELREEIRIDKRTSQAFGKMYRWKDARVVQIENWDDFKAGAPSRTQSFVYDDAGRIIESSLIEGRGVARRFLHIWLENKIRTSTEVGTGATWNYTYEKKRLLSVQERPGPNEPTVETRFSYDKKGRLLTEQRFVDKDRVSWTGWSYDKKGRLVSEATDDRGQAKAETSPDPGALGQEISATLQRPDGNWDRVTRYYYDCSWLVPEAPPPTAAPAPSPEAATSPEGATNPAPAPGPAPASN